MVFLAFFSPLSILLLGFSQVSAQNSFFFFFNLIFFPTQMLSICNISSLIWQFSAYLIIEKHKLVVQFINVLISTRLLPCTVLMQFIVHSLSICGFGSHWNFYLFDKFLSLFVRMLDIFCCCSLFFIYFGISPSRFRICIVSIDDTGR